MQNHIQYKPILGSGYDSASFFDIGQLTSLEEDVSPPFEPLESILW